MTEPIFNFNITANHLDNFPDVESVLISSINEELVPNFSIVIPTYKRPDLLKNALNFALNQTYESNYEVLILDDEGTAEKNSSESVIEDIIKSGIRHNVCLRYYKNKLNLGQIGNWNRCIKLARAPHFVMCHDDDWLKKSFLKNASKETPAASAIAFQCKALDLRTDKTFGNRKKAVVMSLAKIYCRLFSSRKTAPLSIYDLFLRYMNPGNCGILFNTACARKLGGFNPNVFPITDYHFLLQYTYHFGCALVKKQEAVYRIEKNESITTAGKFPRLRYEIMQSLIEYIDGDKEQLREEARFFYLKHRSNISSFWHIPENNIENADVDIDLSQKDNLKKYKKITRRIDYLGAKRYF